ncbi:MAG: hypothetical protein ACFBWO_15585, partial [Paracoccaceae bacterium]
MSKILLTAFEPFGGRSVNASGLLAAEACRRRPGLEAVVLPVDHEAAAAALRATLRRLRPDAVLLTGEWNGPGFRLERYGRPGPLVPHARGVRPARWPNAGAQAAMAARGVPAKLSEDAGRYVCDTTLWSALAGIGGVPPVGTVGFLHVPRSAGGAAARARGAEALLACLDAGLGAPGRPRAARPA